MVVAFSRRGQQDTIMFDHKESYEIQRREDLSLVETLVIPKEDNEGAYDEAEKTFDIFDSMNQ